MARTAKHPLSEASAEPARPPKAKKAAGDEVSDQASETNQTFETAATSTTGHADSDAAALLELLRKTIGSSVDANQVREIVDARMYKSNEPRVILASTF
jgi:hypothetical protein